MWYSTHNNSKDINCSNNNNVKHSIKNDEQKQKKAKTALQKIKVLVVEDEPINQLMTTSLLESKGYFVEIAATGKAALTLYQANHYDAILMDVGLPDIKGTDVTQQIRALEKMNGKHTPIIALTTNEEAKTECLKVGMDDFSLKPFKIEVLNQLLKTWIKKSN